MVRQIRALLFQSRNFIVIKTRVKHRNNNAMNWGYDESNDKMCEDGLDTHYGESSGSSRIMIFHSTKTLIALLTSRRHSSFVK